MEELKVMEELKRLVEEFDGEIYDLCYTVLQRFGETEEVFEYVCKNLLESPVHGTIHIDHVFAEEEIALYKSLYGEFIDGILNCMIKKCNQGLVATDCFYHHLWDSICINFTTLKDRSFAFYYVLIDPTIPYQYLGLPISMSNAQFKKIVDENKESINKLKYILRSGYNQRTEQASLLLNCLDSIDDVKSKTVVLAQAIMLFSKSSPYDRLDAVIQQIDKRIKELEAEESVL